jgi:hypothetical protein
VTPERELLERLRGVLADADVDASELVEEAWSQAREEVRDTLRRLMARDLLDRSLRVLGEQGTGPPRSPARGPVAEEPPGPELRREPDEREPTAGVAAAPGDRERREPSPTSSMTYVFGITGDHAEVGLGELARLPGGGPLRAIAGHGLQAVVCEVDPGTFEALRTPGPDGLDTLAAAAHAHDGALAALARATTVLPLRLGTVLPDDESVRVLLGIHADQLRSELGRVSGHAEWAVTVQLFEDDAALDDDARGASSGSDYLQLRRAALEQRATRFDRRERLAADIHARLAACAVEADTVASRPVEDVAPPLLHGVYLLRDDAVADLERIVAELREEHPRAVIEFSGPWPPYHFVTVDLTPPGGVAT